MPDPDRPPTDPILVTADDREPKTVIAALRNLPGVVVDTRRLKMGDYLVDGRLLVERKTLADFAVSVMDGRLFTQATRLAASPLPAALILEGKAPDLVASGIRREALQGALVSISLVFGISLLRSTSPEETARLMLYATTQMRASASGVLPRQGRRPRGKLRTQLRILQGLPGIGPQRAQRLVEAFGTVEAVLQADTEALQNIPGIGTKTANGIRWAVSEAASPYK